MRLDRFCPSRRRTGLLLTTLLVTSALPLTWLGYEERTRSSYPDLNEWNLDRIECHLQEQGLGLRRVEAEAGRRMLQSMMLTRTNQDWARLERVPKDRRRVREWQGTVYCEKWLDADEQHIHAALWKDCCLLAGPYLFFGDQTILAEIDQALRVPARPVPGRHYPRNRQPRQPV